MVTVTENGVTFDVEELEKVYDTIEGKFRTAAKGCISTGSIVSHEAYLTFLVNHYRAVFPLSSVIVCATEHAIHGQYQRLRYEQKVSVFNNTRATYVYVIGRGLNTVFTLLGHGGWNNWHMSGWFQRDGNTVVFV